MEMGKNHTQNFVKHFNSNLCLTFFVNLIFFFLGLSLGFILTFYNDNNFAFHQLQPIIYTISSSFPPPPLSPLPAPPLVVSPDHRSTMRPSLLHNMDDDELFWRASFVPRIKEYAFNRVPKIAFMFLTKGPIPLAPLWEMFFKGHEGLYNIYVHPHPSYNDSFPKHSVFHQRRIPSKAVEWGKSSMIDAERRLLANALLDFTNERFILLSESCIPLFNFTIVYDYLIASHYSFVASYDDPRKVGRGRYSPKMSPAISIEQWRKGSQWFEIQRSLAVEIVSDQKYYPVFKEFCNAPCYMDEHYIPTLVNIVAAEGNSNRSVTWVDWSKPGPHPGRFAKGDVSEELINRARFGENCSYNGETTSLCVLFGRKFVTNSLQPVLRMAPLLFGSSVQ